MTVYVRVNGVYQAINRPYVHVNGVYAGAKELFVRAGGTYHSAYLYDITPPDPPEITLELHEFDMGIAGVGRYIQVGVRLPSIYNDPGARLVRVLTNYAGAPPTTQFGGTYTSTPDDTYPGEPWSEWRYNNYGPHNDTSNLVYKQWPPNATIVTKITGDKDYWFTGWSLDSQGNWSTPTAASIHVPKDSVSAQNIIVKEARFQANTSGSWTNTGFQSGQLVQQDSPRSRGLWFYGNQLNNSIGSQGTPTIRSAQIFIKREDDTGVANADIHLAWTPYAAVGDLPAPGGSLTLNDMAKVGTLAKGQGAWFDLPTTFYADLSNNVHGMCLNFKDYLKASAFPEDYSVIQQIADNLRCGEIHVTWEEAP